MPEIWGKDAAIFNPYRWLTENGEAITYSPFSKHIMHLQDMCILGLLTPASLEYHAWNAGPRSCLGRPLATYEGITITVAILQRFDIVLSDDSRVYKPLAALNMVMFLPCYRRHEERMMTNSS